MVFWSIVGGLFVLLMAVGWWSDRRRRGARLNLRAGDAGIGAGRGQAQHVATRIHQKDIGGGLGPL